MELVLALLAWISAETGLALAPPPTILFVNQAQMLRLAGGPTDVTGLYDRESVTVYLRDDWDAANLRSRATLLHELVHHVQDFNNVPARCRAEREQLAYKLTLEWLRQQGAPDPYAVLDTDEFSILIRSMCADD
jgi:hypothetical protein